MRPALLALLALLAGCTADSTPATVVGWNVEGVGAPGSVEFESTVAILERLDADVLAIAEISSAADAENLTALAGRLGYPFVVQADGAPFGAMRTAVLSRWPFAGTQILDAPTLSGDDEANDISRNIIVAEIAVPDALPLTVIPVHFKSGGDDPDQFRRAVESWRTRQALGEVDRDRAAYVVVGDVNEELDRVPRQPERFRALPPRLPGAFRLGEDIDDRMVVTGLLNDPFAPLTDPNGPAMAVLDAATPGGVTATGPLRGRRLDYAFVSPALAPDARGSLYDSDDVVPDPAPDPLPAGTSAEASDHLPVIVELEVPPLCIFDADCDDGRWCNGRERCDTGRCVRRPAPCEGTCDEDRRRCG